MDLNTVDLFPNDPHLFELRNTQNRFLLNQIFFPEMTLLELKQMNWILPLFSQIPSYHRNFIMPFIT